MPHVQPRPQSAVFQSCSLAPSPSAMSDLNSPEKPRSEPSLGGSQPHSWSDVTLIEDITQESLHRSLSAQCMGEYVQSSSESEAGQPSPTEPLEQPLPSNIPAQAICVVKRFRMRSRSRGPHLPIAPASGSTQPNHAPGISDKPRLLPLSTVPRPSTGLPAPEPPAARCATPPWSVNSTKRPKMPWDPQPNCQQALSTSFRPRMPQPPSKGGLQPNFFAPPPRWSQHLLGVSVPKPRPLTRPPPRSLAYKPPASHKPEPVKPLGIFTVKDLPSHKPPSAEAKPRTFTRSPAMQPRLEGLISRASRRRLAKRPAPQRGKRSYKL